MDREEILAAHYRLHEHVRFLHAYWYLFRQLYRAPHDQQLLLNAVIPQFFVLLQKALIRTIFLEFRLLTEKPITMGRRNASLPGLLEAVHGPTWKETGAARAVEAIEENNTVKLFVNRVIAHIDWNVASGVEEPPGAVELGEIEEALANTRSVMSHLATELELPQLNYTEARIDSEVAALFALLKGQQSEQPLSFWRRVASWLSRGFSALRNRIRPPIRRESPPPNSR